MYALYDATVVATHSHTRAPPADMLALADKGDNSSVDMLVGDIYGQDYQKIGLKSSTIASSFGKVFRRGEGHGAGPTTEDEEEERRRSFKSEDISRSLLYAISNNIGQIACVPLPLSLSSLSRARADAPPAAT